MTQYEEREKRVGEFNSKLKGAAKKVLLSMRQDEKDMLYETKRKIDLIDQEFSRRKPFCSMHDKMVDESVRCSDKTKCAFYGCDKPSEYYTMIGVKDERYGIFACREHTNLLFEPMHRKLGSADIADMKKAD